jgi:methyl-accepting chemotaxis protein
VARRIAQGDLDQTDLPAGGSDEIGVMSRSFNQMLRSLKGMAASADRIARGDLTVKLETQGQVAEAFNRMVAGQRQIVAQLAETAHSLAAAATEIYASAQSQESAAGQQSAGVVEVSQTMAQLADSATHIAESARGVLGTAERTKQTADETASRIAQLSGLTNRIAELLEVIRDIADRSDLLALNASLEATRAGEAGRSFALVAGEMRRLAERVTATVGDVKALVGDIRTSGATTVLSMEDGRKLAEGTTESARIITEVTQQQRVATAQASESMRSIAQLLRQSADTSVQTRASAELLKRQADRLSEIVGRFRLSADQG